MAAPYSGPDRVRRRCRRTRAALRAVVERLQAIDRPPATAGEREAAEWLRGELAGSALRARIEEEPATGSFAVPVALLSAAGAVAGAQPARAPARGPPPGWRPRRDRRRRLRRPARVPPAAAAPDHVQRRRRGRGPRRAPRPSCSSPTTTPRTAASCSIRTRRAGSPTRSRRWYARSETSPPLMLLVVAGPALAGLGALLGRPPRAAARRLDAARVAAGRVGDVAARSVVPGANDNLAAVAVLARAGARSWPASRRCAGARAAASRPAARSRSWRACAASSRRHVPALPRERTRFVVLECVGGPELIVLEGEGMLRMRDYTPSGARLARRVR